ncbi:MAG: peptidase MA family metallohydrolase [Armatimonadota bacterium]
MRALICLALVLSLLPLHAAGWVAHQTPGVVIYTHRGENTLARQIGRLVELELPRLAAAIGVPSPGPIPIYAFSSQVEFYQQTTPDPFLLGTSSSPSGTIRLDCRRPEPQVRRTLAHELTHSLLNQRLAEYIGELPLWVNEGIAGHLSEPITRAELKGSSELIHQIGILTPEEMEESFHTRHTVDAAYLESRSMIAWLEYRHPGALRRLLDGLAAGQTFPVALHNAAGLTLEAWWQQWQRAVPAFMYWMIWFSSPAVYAPLALLVVILAILRARRKRAEAEEEEEAEEDGEPDT